MEVFHIVLPKADILFKILQKKTFDIIHCQKKIEDFKDFLNILRNEFDSLWERMSASDCYNKKRQQTCDGGDGKLEYRRLYLEIIDNFIVHIQERFSDLHHMQFFGLLDFNKFEGYSVNFPLCLLQNLMDSPYGCNFDRQGLLSDLSDIFSSVSFKVESVSNLHSYIVTNDFSETLPEVSKLIKLILTIPATSASAERSFSH